MIRPAEAGDAAAIAAVWNPYIRRSAITFNPVEKDAAEIAAMIADRQRAGWGFWLAEAPDGGIAGFVTYAQFRGGRGYAHAMEHTIILAPGSGGRGIGRALMRAAEDHARAAGVHVMVAGISAENAAGCAFHAALGYVETGRMPQVGRKFGRWMDLVLMQKILPDPDFGAEAG